MATEIRAGDFVTCRGWDTPRMVHEITKSGTAKVPCDATVTDFAVFTFYGCKYLSVIDPYRDKDKVKGAAVLVEVAPGEGLRPRFDSKGSDRGSTNQWERATLSSITIHKNALSTEYLAWIYFSVCPHGGERALPLEALRRRGFYSTLAQPSITPTQEKRQCTCDMTKLLLVGCNGDCGGTW